MKFELIIYEKRYSKQTAMCTMQLICIFCPIYMYIFQLNSLYTKSSTVRYTLMIFLYIFSSSRAIQILRQCQVYTNRNLIIIILNFKHIYIYMVLN